MADLIRRISDCYNAGQITACEAYHAVCSLVAVLNNELGE